MLYQDTHSRVANSTSSRPRQGSLRRMTSVLNNPITDSVSTLSYESPTLPIVDRLQQFRRDLAIERSNEARLGLRTIVQKVATQCPAAECKDISRLTAES